jgi:daunorubicin resistance ABC transporter ATP-binding subunit
MTSTATNSSPVIEAEHLAKRYGETQALADVSISVAAGSIVGILGPNGAGKSTTVRILTTMTAPDNGWARVGGHDVATDPKAVRRIIGVTGQDATLDEMLTGVQNLVLIGELSGLSRKVAVRRAAELLDHFELTAAGGRVVKGYSGGMRRRLDLAASIVADPPVLFLDEPTTGLDPVSRQRMWDVIRDLVSGGTTLLLTTQYLDEADVLADRIAVVDHGMVIAEGTPNELKTATGEARMSVTLVEPSSAARALLVPFASGDIHVIDGRHLSFAVRQQPGLATEVVRTLDAHDIRVDDIAVERPSLDDVFFALTASPATDSPSTHPTADPELEGALR